MTQALFAPEGPSSLADFFARLHECRNKSAHVHGLHPYPAKFIPHIPRELIRAFARPGDVVLDPMCGSGTTLVEASVAGLEAIGADLNPIATLVSRAKTSRLTAEERLALRGQAGKFQSAAVRVADAGPASLDLAPDELPSFHNREKWFADHVTRELGYAKRLIDTTCVGQAHDLACCSFSAVLVGVSNQESETRWCAKPTTLRAGEALARLSMRVSDSLARTAVYEGHEPSHVTVHTSDARALPIHDESVDLIVTSPPYANSHDYYLYNKLRMFWLGYDVQSVQRAEIGSRNRHSDMREDIESYVEAMASVMREARRVARPGAVAAFVVADAVIRSEFFDMADIYDVLAEEQGWRKIRGFSFSHKRFNATFQNGFGTSRSKQTHVLIYRA